jgi:putative transposase
MKGLADGQEKEKTQSTANNMACARRTVGQDRTNYPQARPAQTHGAKTHQGACGSGRNHLPHAKRLSMEQFAQRIPRRQLGAPNLSAMDSVGVAGGNLGGPGQQLRRTGRGRLAMAGGRYGYEQGAFWGDCVGPNPTDRSKNGVKRSLLVERYGGPVAVAVAGANVHDTKMLETTIEAIVVERPAVTEDSPQNLCLDKGYDNPTGWEAATGHDYTPHIRRIGEEKLDTKGRKKYPARRWVVERTLGWLSKCRAILVRYDKKACNYLGLIKLACALFWYRRLWRLTVLR